MSVRPTVGFNGFPEKPASTFLPCQSLSSLGPSKSLVFLMGFPVGFCGLVPPLFFSFLLFSLTPWI